MGLWGMYGRDETCDENSADPNILAEAPSQRLTETDPEIVLLIEKIGPTSTWGGVGISAGTHPSPSAR